MMKKVCFIMMLVVVLVFAGCTANDNTDNSNAGVTEDQRVANMEKFLHNGDTYTAELFVEMAETYDERFMGEGQQSYVFDLRSVDEYNAGHIVGAINVEFAPKDAESFVERIPSDWSVYVIGDSDEEAKAMVAELKKVDDQLFAYAIEGGYDALLETDCIDKYISTEPGAFTDFTRTEAAKQFEEYAKTTE